MRTGLLRGMSALLPICSAARPSHSATAAAKRVEAKLCGLPHSGVRSGSSVVQVKRGFAWEAQAQSTVRSTAARAGADSWGFDQARDSDYKVGSIPYDALASNAVSLIGYTGRDVDIKRLQTGNTVGNLTLAVNHKAGETTWYEIDIWGPMAQRIADQVPKGSRICVQGKLNPSSWTNKDGFKQTKFKITASEVRFVERDGSAPSGQAAGQAAAGWGAQQPQLQQAWGAPQDQFEQAPPAGTEWGGANNVVPPAQQPFPSAQPARALGPESSAEEKWNSVRSSPGLWWDNRENKRNPKAPDYKLKDVSQGNIALWLNSRDTPEWAKQELQVAAAAVPSGGFTDMN